MSSKGMSGHQRAYEGHTDEWLTPPEIIKALGSFDLDPCSPVDRPWPTARRHFTVNDNGFDRPWSGRVWLNPPYGPNTGKWLARLAEHGNGVALVFARTETEMFFETGWNAADGMLFLKGRLHFHYVDGVDHKRCQDRSHKWEPRPDNPKAGWCRNCGMAKANSGAPSVLIAYGQRNVDALRTCGLKGAIVHGIEVTT